MQTPSLASWSDTPVKRSILDFVERVCRKDSPGFVPPEDRVAVFDNDGTLWCERPLPVQFDFLLRRLGEQAGKDASLRGKQPWKAAAEKDHAWLGGAIAKHYRGDDGDLRLMAGGLLKAFEGETVEAFGARAKEFLRTSRHPTLGRPYLECAYRPMVELLRFFEEAGFASYIVSGGGRDFMRPITQSLYGIPMDRVIGSSVALAYEDEGAFAEIVHRPDLDLFDDGPAKPVRIWSRAGRRPIFAAGNSNGDIPMLRFCEHPSRPSLGLLIDHDDEAREFAYRDGAEQALEMARSKGWGVVSVKNDWTTVFSPAEARVESAA